VEVTEMRREIVGEAAGERRGGQHKKTEGACSPHLHPVSILSEVRQWANLDH
jgi:hypothetical protein